MILSAFAFLFAIGFIAFLLSTRINEKDLTNTYQVQLSFLSMIIFTTLVLASFNLELVYSDGAAVFYESFVDYGYLAASLAMFFMNLINIIVLLMWGSYNMLFNRRTL